MNRKLASLLILLMLALSTLACLPGGLLGGKEADQPPSAGTSEPAAAAPTTPPEPTAALEPALAPVAMLGEEQRSDHGGFVFQTIPGYTLEEEFGFASIEAPDADPEVGPAVLLMGGVTEGDTSAEGLFDGFVDDLEAGMEVSEPHEITVGGVSGLAADVSGTVEGKELVARVVFVAVTPTQSFNVFAVAPSDRWDDELEPLFDAVLASVSFFEPAAAEGQPAEAGEATSGTGAGGEIRQWATSATASSEYSNPRWSASQATGAPDTPDCGDSATAWAASNDNTVEWLELRYDVPVRPTQVNVIQSNSPDQVVFVDLLDTEGEYHDIYLGEPEGKLECPYILSIPVGDANYLAVGVKITLDQSVIAAPWNEIDAVELVGYVSGSAEVPSAAPPPESADTPIAAQPTSVWTSYSQYSTGGGLAEDHVKAVAVSPDGVVWFGTDGGGLSIFDGQDWTTYTKQDGLADDYIKALAVAPDGAVWIGTFGLGISRLTDPVGSKQWTTYTNRDGLPHDNILSLAVAPDGSVWAGTAGGVSRFDGQQWTSYTTQDGLAHGIVHAIAVVSDGTVWAGTNGGVSRFDGQQWSTYTTGDGLAHDRVESIAEDLDGAMWFGTLDGVSRFDGQQWTTYRKADGLADRKVFAIAIQDDGVMWFGTNWGLSRFDGQSWTTFTGRDGLLNDSITGLALAPDGSLWASTPTGVSHYALAE
jgi:hypothetical protein